MLLLCCQVIIRGVREQWGGWTERGGGMRGGIGQPRKRQDNCIFQIAQLIVSKKREVTMKVENHRILVALRS